MGTNIFISFRFSDGNELKEELEELFDSSTEVFNRSEDEDRSTMSEDTIQKYLYEKLRQTSVTIVLLTPEAISYKKNFWGSYDDWLYDELRYSLEDRNENHTNGVIAVYTDESKNLIISESSHTCNICNVESECQVMLEFDNLVRKNVLNVKSSYKSHPCDNLFDSDKDSYISLIHIDDFKKDYEKHIEAAKEKRDRKNEFELVKKM